MAQGFHLGYKFLAKGPDLPVGFATGDCHEISECRAPGKVYGYDIFRLAILQHGGDCFQ